MKLLAIDTAAPATLVAARSDDATAARRDDPAEHGGRPRHTELALAYAHDALADLGVGWEQLERIGVVIGPGSFTGLRSGIAAACALARRLAVPVAPLQAADVQRASAADGPTAVVLDGRRGELFVCRYPEGSRSADALLRVRRDDVGAIGDVDGWCCVGSGALLVRAELEARGAVVPGAPASHERTAEALVTCTAEADPVDAAEVRAVYGRDADAVPSAERTAST